MKNRNSYCGDLERDRGDLERDLERERLGGDIERLDRLGERERRFDGLAERDRLRERERLRVEVDRRVGDFARTGDFPRRERRLRPGEGERERALCFLTILLFYYI